MTDSRQDAYAEDRRLYREAIPAIRYQHPDGSPKTNIDPALQVAEAVKEDQIMGEVK